MGCSSSKAIVEKPEVAAPKEVLEKVTVNTKSSQNLLPAMPKPSSTGTSPKANIQSDYKLSSTVLGRGGYSVVYLGACDVNAVFDRCRVHTGVDPRILF